MPTNKQEIKRATFNENDVSGVSPTVFVSISTKREREKLGEHW